MLTTKQLGDWSEATIRSSLVAAQNHIKNDNFLGARATLDATLKEIKILRTTAPSVADAILPEYVSVNNALIAAMGGRKQIEIGREPSALEKLQILRAIPSAAAGTPGAAIRSLVSTSAAVTADQVTEAARKAAECAKKPLKCWWENTSITVKILTVCVPGVILLGAALVVLQPYVTLASKIIKK